MLRVFSLMIFGLFVSAAGQNSGSPDGAGQFAIRTGVNVSHWLSQSERRGEERRTYITRADFDSIASMGFDHVRIPVDEEQLWDTAGRKHAEAFALLHNAIGWAFGAHLRVIVDLHIIRSHYFNAESNRLWSDPAEQEKLVKMWQQLAGELRQYPNDKLAYEILNEAVAKDPNDWNRVFNKVLAALRAKEPERKIVLGSNMWQSAGTFPQLRIPENDPNLILSFHFYTPMALTHHTAPWTKFGDYAGPVHYPGQIVDTARYKEMSPAAVEAMREYANGFFTEDSLEKIIMPAITVAAAHHLQLYCGEFGVYPKIPEDIMLRYYGDLCDVFRRNHIAYCHWNYKADFPVVQNDGTPKAKLVAILTAK